MKLVKNKIQDKILQDKLAAQVWTQYPNQSENQISNQVRVQVHDLVWYEIHDLVWIRVKDLRLRVRLGQTWILR